MPNSLTNLNTYGATTLSFTDNRTPSISFDRGTAATQTGGFTTGGSTTKVPAGINIINITNGAGLAIYYQINVSTISGATVAWSTTPSGCTVTNPSTGVYRMTNITTADQWNIVKNPTITLPNTATVHYEYSASIVYTTGSKSWTIILDGSEQAALASTTTTSATGRRIRFGVAGAVSSFGFAVQITPVVFEIGELSDVYFVANNLYPGTVLTSYPQLTNTYATGWTVVVTPSNANAVTYIYSPITDSAGGIRTTNGTTKAMTVTGTRTQINATLASLYYTTPDSSRSDFTLTYSATNSNGVAGNKIQQFYTTEYISATRAVDTYSFNTATTITGGALITDSHADGLGYYTMTITPNTTSAVQTMSSTGKYGVANVFSITPSTTQSLFGQAIATSTDDSLTLVGAPGANKVFVFNSSYALTTTITGDGQFGTTIGISQDKSTFVIHSPSTTITVSGTPRTTVGVHKVYTANGSLQATLLPENLGGTYSNAQFELGGISSDGNTIIIFSRRYSASSKYIRMFTRSGSTWTEGAVTTVSGQGDIDTIGAYGNVVLDSTGTKLFVGSPNHAVNDSGTGGAVLYYTRAGSTWTLAQTIRPSDPTNGNYFGKTVKLAYDNSRLTIESGLSTGLAQYTFTYSSTWQQEDKITTPAYGMTDSGTQLVMGGTGEIYNRIGGTWTKTGQFTPPATGSLKTVSVSGILFYGDTQTTINGYQNTGSVTVIARGQGTSFNNTTKVLTLSGTKADINFDIDTIQLTPGTGYTGNFTLTYTVTTPELISDSRDQAITRV